MASSKNNVVVVNNIYFLIIILLVVNIFFIIPICNVNANKFEPYELNGGLITGIAGHNYCLLASDTRLMDGGYEIYTRNHISSRLWFATSDTDNTNTDSNNNDSSSSFIPVLIGSSGCSSDCESLKRYIRSEIRSTTKLLGGGGVGVGVGVNNGQQLLSVNNVATLLSQILYLRRGFPFYSFCVVTGLSSSSSKVSDVSSSLSTVGEVYVYDAIGSFEQVAIGTSGTGRELLQPILDRLFVSSSLSSSTSNSKSKSTTTTDNDSNDSESSSSSLLQLSKTKTHVDCNVDEAISKLIKAYKSVCEREISIGDNLVIIVLQQKQKQQQQQPQQQEGRRIKEEDQESSIKILNIPLKQH